MPTDPPPHFQSSQVCRCSMFLEKRCILRDRASFRLTWRVRILCRWAGSRNDHVSVGHGDYFSPDARHFTSLWFFTSFHLHTNNNVEATLSNATMSNVASTMLPFLATMSKQRSTLLPKTATMSNEFCVEISSFRQSRTLLRHCCPKRQHCRSNRQQSSLLLRHCC